MCLDIRKTTIKVDGLKKEYKFLQISDLHMLKMDERDSEARRKGYKKRADDYFTLNGVPTYDLLPTFLEVAKSENALPIFTGDTVDIPTESAYEVFAAWKVYRSFASYRAVYLGEQCGWYLDKSYTTQICSCGITGNIACDSASECYKKVSSCDSVFCKKVVYLV